ncbi:MAG TPA: SusC/RagA family TonB-linked outer membrane protein, partial [Bacteroidales bacterium]|nr:SusC/RagA family TonB-linked outer membrane protein [Bacteroidales bacterium]
RILDKNIVVTRGSFNTTEVQQGKSVSGKVTDSTGGSLPGVSVVLKGTTTGTITDANGNYSINNIPANATLQFSFIGMKSQEISVDGKTTINIALSEETFGIDEVVAVGYGTQKKATATGAISVVKGENLIQSPTTNFANSLAGRFAGVTTVTSSGEPGNDGASIRIRGVGTTGNASALIVVDGIAGRNLNTIDANDIESVTILKDASAAIYGARGANGVVLVTTKRGKIGKPKVTFSLNQGISQATVLPEMANSAQYATMVNEINYYATPASGRNQTFSEAEITKFGNGSDLWQYPNTDWYKSVLKPWTNQNSQNMTISGGNENTQFNISVGARNQDAIYQRSSTGYSQYNFRSNVDTKITNDISIVFDVAGREEIRKNLAPINTSIVDPFSSAVGAGDIYQYILQGKPTMNAFWPNGQPGPDIENGMNAAVVATDVPGYDKDKLDVFESNLGVRINIPWVKGLSVKGNVSVDAQFESRKIWKQPFNLYAWNGRDASNLPLPLLELKKGPGKASLNQAAQSMRTVTSNALINYVRQFGAHSVDALAGYERSATKVDRLSAYRGSFPTTALDELVAGNANTATNTGDEGTSVPGRAYWDASARVSYFGRVNYGYAEKYLIGFVWRYDGSNIFAPGHQFGFFPGFSAGWRVSEENFWKENLSFISYFKIRGSYGTTGNDRVQPYQYLANYGYSTNQGGEYIFGGVADPLLNQTVVPNPIVTWETAVQRNIGFEAQLLNNKLGVEFDYFHNSRSDILLPLNGTVPGSTGITTSLPDMNMGKTATKGVDIVLSYKDKINALTYNITLTSSYAKSNVDYMDEVIEGVPSYQLITGKPIPNNIRSPYYELYYQAIGIYKDQAQIDNPAIPHWVGARPGDIIFKDVNADGKIDVNDRVRDEYNNTPRFTGGLNIDLKYKQFDLSVLFQGAAGATQTYLPYSGLLGNFPKDFADNRWTPENTDASYPRATNLSEYWYIQRTTFFLHRTDYLRVKNVVIGYTLSPKVIKLIRAESLRFFVSANNLFTFTNFKNFDPEMNNERGRGYPVQRVVNGGITLTF